MTAPGRAPVGIRVVLASQSPARLATLRAAGITPLVRVSQVDEDAVLSALPGGRAFAGGPTAPADEVAALAAAKCRAIADGIVSGAIRVYEGDAPALSAGSGGRGGGPDRLVVIGCDSMLEMDGQMLGKPHSPDVARARIRQMRSRSAVLWTGHHAAVLDGDAGPRRWRLAGEAGAAASTVVHFGGMSEEEIDAYVDSGEPLEVAGSFTVDGLGGPFITGIEGDYHSVVGLSLPLMREVLRGLGIFWPDLWDVRRGTAS